MARCEVCGKRIWSELVSIPGKGDYHYDCADQSGVLLLLEIDRESLKKKSEELLKELATLGKQRMEGGDPEGLVAVANRLNEELVLLRMQEMILVKREQKAAQQKKGV